MKMILASASPRRRELLTQIGFTFEVRVSQAEEKLTQSDAALAVEGLASQKAEAVFAGTVREEAGDVLVIGADTVVAKDGRILGKPGSLKEAAEMLSWLSGSTHEVYTGVALICRQDGRVSRKIFHEATKVIFYPMSEREISEYVSTADCMDKAGAYGIQGFCARYIKGIEGDYNNVVGLPAGRVYQEIKEWLGQ